ncbi:MAG: mechanosensitive ion channel family protein [Candidatus Aminicenantes bacterium]|nr:mechanosensitive ion channel family protein [Candidatus Aminicenantes bacterium]
MKIEDILLEARKWSFTTGLKILLIVLIAVVLLFLSRALARRLRNIFLKGRKDEEAIKRARTLSSLIRQVLYGIIIIISGLTVLGALGIQIGPLLATAGVAGVALSFGAQNLIKDLINGFFLILWDQVRVGDVIEVAGKSGLVESINFKMVVLRDLAGNVHYIPNSKIEVVTNMSKEYSGFVFDVPISYFDDADRAMEVMKKVDDEIRQDPAFSSDILAPLEIFGVDRFADSAVIIKARTKTKPLQQWRVGREFNRRLKQAFEENGITIPFSNLTVWLGNRGAGRPETINVKLVNGEEKGH